MEVHLYRDDLLGADYYGNAFICEPVHNLVTRLVLEPDGITFAGHRDRGEERSEFFASADNWFRPVQVRTGPDGALWFTAHSKGPFIGRITTGGAFTVFQQSSEQITAGPDGALWFTDPDHNSVGRITTGGAITVYPLSTPYSAPWGITAGSDDAVWFAELGNNRIGRITPAGEINPGKLRFTRSIRTSFM